MKRIVFIPSLLYLSNNLYASINKHLPEVEKIYFDFNYQLNSRYSHDYQKEIENIRDDFNKIVFFEDQPSYNILPLSNKYDLMKYYFKKSKFNLNVIQELKSIKPDLFVLASDKTDAFNLIRHYFNSTPALVIQQAFLSKTKEEKASLKVKIHYSILEKLFRYPTLPTTPWFKNGNNEGNLFKAFWSPFWAFDGNYDKNKIFFTGNGTIDEDINIGNIRLQSNSNYKLEQPRIVYFSQPINQRFGLGNQNKINQLVKEFLNDLSSFDLIIKVHPREDIQFYNDFFQEVYPSKIQIIKDINNSFLLKERDLVITGCSTLVVKSIAMGVPVILMNPGDIFDYNKIFPTTGIEIVKTIEQFKAAYSRLMTLQGIEKFRVDRNEILRALNTFPDSKSSFRLADLIKELAQIHV